MIDESFESISQQMLSDAEIAEESIEGQVNASLSQEQIAELLNEIESEDSDLASAELGFMPDIDYDNEECSDKSIVTEENFISQDYISGNNSKWFDKVEYKYLQPNEESTDINSVSAAMDRAQKIKNAQARSVYERKLRKIEINRMAFDQDVIRLADTFAVEHKRLLIRLLTNKYHVMIRKYEDYITGRVNRILAPAIPRSIKHAYRKWPWIFVQNPGFMYKTHLSEFRNYKEVKSFWINTNLPYFFKQGTEQIIFEERCEELSEYVIPRLDRAVHMYYNAKEMLSKREVQYAARLLKLDGTTVSMGMRKPRGSENSYYSLLQLDPFWFEILYDELRKQKNNELL